MAGAVPSPERPAAKMLSFCQPLLRHSRTAGSSPIVRSAQQAPPADPSEQGVVQPAA